MTDPVSIEQDVTAAGDVVAMLKDILESLGKLHAKIDNSGAISKIEDDVKGDFEKVVRL